MLQDGELGRRNSGSARTCPELEPAARNSSSAPMNAVVFIVDQFKILRIGWISLTDVYVAALRKS